MPGRVGDSIAAQVRRRPRAAALVAPDGTLDYAELDRRSADLAGHLTRQGVRAGDVVLIQASRGVALGVAVLAVLRSGGAFCVVDPQYPADRVQHMWRRSHARFALVEPGLRTPDEPDGPVVIPLREYPTSGAAHGAPAPHVPAPGSEDPAYLVFTSGSTGGPKAVSMPHRCVDNLIEWTLASTSPEPLRTLMFAPLGFDVFVQEVLTAWCSGGCLYTPSDAERVDLQRMWELCREWGIQRIFLPPVALRRLAELTAEFGILPGALREVAVAGEALHITPAVRDLFTRLPAARLHNHYGPAETHVAVAHTLTGPPHSWPDLPPIGRPLPGMTAHVDPPAQGGELWLAGAGLAHGYVHDPKQTRERFRSRRIEGRPVRAYRTGDLVRERPDGVLEYLGRTDGQLKIRGYRVEPGDIETILLRHPAVRECAVTAWTPPGADERKLVAHVVAGPGQAPEAGELRAHVARLLPDYMVPHHVVLAPELPLSPNGKIDRRRLPEPGEADDGAGPLPEPGDVRSAVTVIWSTVLGVADIPPDRHFADLGGTSLSAALVVTRIQQRFQVRVSVQEFLYDPRVDAITALITERAAA
ncbi:non-ribosomal peptide synthetase [Streptomyces sp. NRRL B-1140]|uniref:non-ribosomal peptide synthetase n=1 Tax=Streptomyces sp. NRRL B-1140 TaxID=1415549 RepID=UPI0006AD8CC8|nr:non-ribosomal peptide synthetase [Streptomyces sp. NRRL B-1140]